MKRIIKLQQGALARILRSRYVQKFGLVCWKCGRPLNEGETVLSRMRSKGMTKYYCLDCAISLHLIDESDLAKEVMA